MKKACLFSFVGSLTPRKYKVSTFMCKQKIEILFMKNLYYLDSFTKSMPISDIFQMPLAHFSSSFSRWSSLKPVSQRKIPENQKIKQPHKFVEAQKLRLKLKN